MNAAPLRVIFNPNSASFWRLAFHIPRDEDGTSLRGSSANGTHRDNPGTRAGSVHTKDLRDRQ
jgi:hypothetical protein